MSPVAWLLVIGVPLLLLAVILEGMRQEKRYGPRGTGARLVRTGLLELQSQLEPERKVEMLKQEPARDLLVVVDPSGDPQSPLSEQKPKRR